MLTYHVPGMTPDYVEEMESRERRWWVDRVGRQKADEAKAVADGAKG